MKNILVTVACASLMTGAAFAQTASLSFNDFGAGGAAANSGSYAPGSSFSFDITLSTAGQAAGDATAGLSYWFETSGIASTNGYFTISNRNFIDTLNGFGTSPFNFGIQNPTGDVIMSGGNVHDMGGTVGLNPGEPPNMAYFVATITLQISATAAPGTYTISSTTGNPRISEATNHTAAGAFVDMIMPATSYTVTVLPEPATWSLIGLGALGVLEINLLRARKRS